MARPGCIFCGEPTVDRVLETVQFYAKWDGFPLTPGHALVIPRRHVVSLFELAPDEVAEAFWLLSALRAVVEDKHRPAGYNVGVNDGRAAGRTVDHLHIHLIPRYVGDVGDPRGGVRNILPGPSPDLWSSPQGVVSRG